MMMRMIFTILLFLLFGSYSNKLVQVSEATNTTTPPTILNCFRDRPSSRGVNDKPEKLQLSCGREMEYPFWPMEGEASDEDVQSSSTRGQICGYPGFGYSCTDRYYSEENTSVLQVTLNISNEKYYVQEIDLTSKLLHMINAESINNNCLRPLKNFTLDEYQRRFTLSQDLDRSRNLTIFYNCSVAPPPGSYNKTFHRNGTSCLDYNKKIHSYAFFDEELNDKGVNIGQPLLRNWSNYVGRYYCDDIVIVPILKEVLMDSPYDYDIAMRKGFVLSWSTPSGYDYECSNCEENKGLCVYNIQNGRYLNCSCPPGRYLDDGYCSVIQEKNNKVLPNRTHAEIIPDSKHAEIIPDSKHAKIRLGIKVSSGIGGLVILILLFSFIYLKIRKKRRETASNTQNVELFLENYGCHSLQRYKYSQIKKITNSFKEELGKGGFGTVYKGMLVDGRNVAVKVLISDPKRKKSGEDFMNEVATIGRTNHVNIVALIGFCSSGTRRALVYEFMANGSLEKFIYIKNQREEDANNIEEKKHPLQWEKLYQISLGIARGLEYLHRGCNTRILHFDIKPHNILLDENYCPKISDFGLAKLCPTRDSVVSMNTGGRGTPGYTAPEFSCRNLGGVSHKSDVYSYGMMVFEMVGGRKNIDPNVENASEIYFPRWIYNHLQEQEENIGNLLKCEEAVEEEMVKKMIMAALWCIQTNPADRPSIGNVVDMLEGSIDNLPKPPKPFADSSSSSFPPPKSRG